MTKNNEQSQGVNIFLLENYMPVAHTQPALILPSATSTQYSSSYNSKRNNDNNNNNIF